MYNDTRPRSRPDHDREPVTPARVTVAPWGESLAELVEAAVAAEAAGADAVWVPEMHRSASVALAAVAQATTRVRVGTAVMLAFVRSPLTVALESLDLDELSDGRLVLGLGTGVRRLNEDWHNVAWERPVAHLRDVVRDVRHIVAHAHEGEPIVLDGDRAPVRITGFRVPWAPRRRRIPIHVAAVGPQMTRLAGEIGDGWIAHELGSPRYLRERVLPNLEAGLARAGRRREDVEVVASACCVPHPDPARAKRWAAGLIAFYATVKTYEPLFEFHGFLAQARAVRAAFVLGDRRAMLAAVPDAMVDALALADTPERVRERLGEYDGLADAVKLSPPTHLVAPASTRAAQEHLLAMVGSA